MRAWLLVLACSAGCGARSELGLDEGGQASTSATNGSSSSGGGGGSSSSSASSSSSSASSSASSSGGGGASPLSGVVAISAGFDRTCAVTAAGSLWCWGANQYGELGDGSTLESHVPVAVTGLGSNVSAVSGGQHHACALTKAGSAHCWGKDDHGQLGSGSTLDSQVPLAVAGLQSAVASMASGVDHVCAVKTTGELLCWGAAAGTMLFMGQVPPDSDVPVAVAKLTGDVKAVTAGYQHTCALTTAGGVLCWGWNQFGQLGGGMFSAQFQGPAVVSSLSSGVTAISAGWGHTCALTEAGAVQCWGWNQFEQLGNGSLTDSLTPVAVAGLASGVAAISAGEEHTCALTAAGGVFCWGDNMNGQLGNGSQLGSSVPVVVSGLASGMAAISAGNWHTCAMTTANLVLCWGGNWNGQLGDGTTTDRFTPVPVLAP